MHLILEQRNWLPLQLPNIYYNITYVYNFCGTKFGGNKNMKIPCRNSSLDNRACQQSLNTSMQYFAHHRLRQAYYTKTDKARDGRNIALKY